MIISHKHLVYANKRKLLRGGKYTGAYYYSIEIVDNIIPMINTDRNWITINIPDFGCNHAIVFIHNNKFPQLYEWLSDYDDLILVCGVPETCDKVKHLGTPIYLPLSVDVEYLQKFQTEKTKEIAYAGRKQKRKDYIFPPKTDFLEGMPREELLKEIAKYKQVYAVGRTAIEAKVLGCDILPYDERFPDPSFWQVVDNKDAAILLQQKLDDIDKKKR